MPVQDFIGWVAAPDRGPSPRAMLVVAHPADEVFGIGSRLHRFGEGLTMIYVTAGRPASWSLEPDSIATRPARSFGIRHEEASFHLARVARELALVIAASRPSVLFTHAYEGGHPDHDATAFAVHAACALVEARARYTRRSPGDTAAPVLIEMASCHHGEGPLTAGDFIPHPGVEAHTVHLTPEECDRKRRLMGGRDLMGDDAAGSTGPGDSPLATERFRPAPHYAFTRPPHEGALHYERLDGSMTGPHWRVLAALAAAELAGTP